MDGQEKLRKSFDEQSEDILSDPVIVQIGSWATGSLSDSTRHCATKNSRNSIVSTMGTLIHKRHGQRSFFVALFLKKMGKK